MSGGGHQSRPFSPYRHAPTTEDLLHAAVRGRALAIPEEDEKSKAASVVQSQLSKTPSAMQSRHNKAPSHGGKTASQVSTAKQPSAVGSKHVHGSRANASPRPPSPGDLDLEEARIVNEALANQTPRTSYYAASALDPAAANHFHDLELCVLLHQESDSTVHEVVKKALRKAVRQRIKRLGMKYDNEVRLIYVILIFSMCIELSPVDSQSGSTRSHIMITIPVFIFVRTRRPMCAYFSPSTTIVC